MKILVTGAAGFIGHHLVKRLIYDGHEVIGLDNFQTGSRENLTKGVLYVIKDVREMNEMNDLNTRTFDRIYHLACPASPPHYQKDQLDTLLTCFDGTHAVLRAACRWKARILIASTSEVYGDPTVSPQSETYRGNVEINGPRSCYDEGKRAAETLATLFGKQCGVSVRIARIFNTFGPKMTLDDGRMIPNLVVQALRGDPLTVYGDGRQTRSCCYIDDLIDGLVRLMECPREGLGPVNLGSTNEHTVRFIADTIRDMTNSYSGIDWKPLPVDDPQQRCPSIAKARQELGWAPRVGLGDGLRLTITDIKQRLQPQPGATS